MELVILGIILLAVILIAKGGMMYLRKIKAETGYNPLGFLNGLLIIGVFAFSLGAIGVMDSVGNGAGFLVALGAIACVAGLVFRNRILKNPMRIILVTGFQLLAPALTLLGILYKRSGGIMGNAATRANLGGAASVVDNTPSYQPSARDYTSGQDELARNYGFANAEEAKKNGIDMKTMM